MLSRDMLRSVLTRWLSASVVVCSFFIAAAGTAAAAPAGVEQSAGTSGAATAISGVSIAGMSVATAAWVLAGLIALSVGMVSASKSGNRQLRAVTAKEVAGGSPSLSDVVNDAQTDRGNAAIAVG